MKRFLVLLFVASQLLSLAVVAETTTPFQQFTQDLTAAYANYRTALFQTNKNDQEKSLKSTTAFHEQWQALMTQYADAPPEVFAADPQWKSSLETIEQTVVASLEEIKAGQIAEAHETLEAVRDELGDVRRRNSVIMFSDHINTYHEVMEHVMEWGAASQTLDAKAMLFAREQLSVLDFLAENIRQNTPQTYADNEKFQQLTKGLFASLAALREALDSNESEAILQAIKNLKAPYAKLFVNFG